MQLEFVESAVGLFKHRGSDIRGIPGISDQLASVTAEVAEVEEIVPNGGD